jgi:HAD superfamily hydrolase (TIGR01450 family)
MNDVVLCDLDGVIWLAHEPIPGSAAAVERLRAWGARVLFVTNNSSATVAEQEAALATVGIPAVGDVVTSAHAAAMLVEPGERVLVCGGPGVVEALHQRGVDILHPRRIGPAERVDAVMVGFHRDFDYATMSVAATAVRRGARLIGTNDDATYPTPDGPIPGGGSILAGIVTASGATPVIAGKPYAPMAELVRSLVGVAPAANAVMVGDRPETDGAFARTLGCRWALVYTGVTPSGVRPCEPTADIVADDLAAVVEEMIGSAATSG